MANQIAKHDPDRTTTLLGVDSVSFTETTTAAVNPATHALLVEGASGTAVAIGDAFASKITTVGSVTYIGIALPGTAQSSALWQAKKIDSSTPNETLILWADGDAQFNNVSSDLTALSYS